jgi:hypothetical protein
MCGAMNQTAPSFPEASQEVKPTVCPYMSHPPRTKTTYNGMKPPPAQCGTRFVSIKPDTIAVVRKASGR